MAIKFEELGINPTLFNNTNQSFQDDEKIEFPYENSLNFDKSYFKKRQDSSKDEIMNTGAANQLDENHSIISAWPHSNNNDINDDLSDMISCSSVSSIYNCNTYLMDEIPWYEDYDHKHIRAINPYIFALLH